MKDRHNENYEMLQKEIAEDTAKQKDFFCSWITRINIVKVAISSKAIYR
jgi:hypothetical protein